MSDEIESLEREMARMRPRGLTPDLALRIEAPLAHRNIWPDCVLMGAMSSGAMAACLIVLLLARDPVWQGTPTPVAGGPVPRAGDLSIPSARAAMQVASAGK